MVFRSFSGDFPYFDNNGEEQITDFEEFVEFLRNSRQDVVLDNDLVPRQICEFEAYSSLLKQKLMPAMVIERIIYKYFDRSLWISIFRLIYFGRTNTISVR